MAEIRGTPLVGCYALVPGAWEDGYVLYEGIRKPRWIRLDSVPQPIPLHMAFRVQVDPPIGRGLDQVGWWPIARDTALVYATNYGWSGYLMRVAVEGDSIRGRAEEASDVVRHYRAHDVRGTRVPCSARDGSDEPEVLRQEGVVLIG